MSKLKCPHCDEWIVFSVRGKKKKTKEKPKYAVELLREVVDHYLKVKGVTDETAIKLQYPRLMKASKKYLMGTGGDVDLIKSKISHAKDFFEGKGLDWKLETINKFWQEIDDNSVNDQYVGW